MNRCAPPPPRQRWISLLAACCTAIAATAWPATGAAQQATQLLCARTLICPPKAPELWQRDGFALRLAWIERLSTVARLMNGGPGILPPNQGTQVGPAGQAPKNPDASTTGPRTAERDESLAEDAEAQIHIGNVLALQTRYDEAQARYERALAIVAQRPDEQVKAAACSNLGVVAAAQGRYDEARQRLDQALLRYRQSMAGAPAPLAVPGASSPCAMAVQSAPEPAASRPTASNPVPIDALRQRLAAQLAAALRARRAGAASAPPGAAVGSESNLPDQTRQTMVQMVEAPLQEAGVLRSLLNLANLAGQLTRYSEAEELLEQAREQASRSAVLAAMPVVLVEQSVLARRLGRGSSADDLLRRARQARGRTAASAGLLGDWTVALGAASGTIASNGSEPERMQPSHDPEAGLRRLLSEASTRDSAGDQATASKLFSRAAALASASRRPDEERLALTALQRLFAARQRPEAAIWFGKRAVNAAQTLRLNLAGMDRQTRRAFLQERRNAYTVLAELLLERDRLAEAEQVLRMLKEDEGQQAAPTTAPAVRAKLPYTNFEAHWLARHVEGIEQVRKVESEASALRAQASNGAVPEGRQAQEDLRRGRHLDEIAQLLAGWNEAEDAKPDARVERARRVASISPADRAAADAQFLLDFAWDVQGLREYAEEAFANLRALGADGPTFLKPLTPAETTRVAGLVEKAVRLNKSLERRTAFLAGQAFPPRPALNPTIAAMLDRGWYKLRRIWTLDRRLEQLDAERLQDEESMVVPRAVHLLLGFSEAEVATLDAGRDLIAALPTGTVALYYLPGPARTHVLMVTPQGRRAFQLPLSSDDLAGQVQSFRQVLQDRRADVRGTAKALYDALVAPLEPALTESRAQTLMLALDGPLRYLPFAALHDGDAWLIQRWAVATYTTASPAALTARPAGTWRVAAFGNSVGGQGMPALYAVPKELADVVRDPAAPPGAAQRGAGALPGAARLDNDFTAASLRTVLRSPPQVVHLASHFALDGNNPAASFLLLGDGGRLTLAELGGVDYRFSGVELVTLSACDTALDGRNGFGQEVDGLANLLQAQGAAAVLATLWSVNDASTAEFMRKFYLSREQRGLSRADALRQAQLALIGEAPSSVRVPAPLGSTGPRGATRPGAVALPTDPAHPYAHPYYWAPFVLMGNWL